MMLWNGVTNRVTIFGEDFLSCCKEASRYNIDLPSDSSKLLLDDINKRIVRLIRRGVREYLIEDYPFAHSTEELSTHGENK